MNVIEVYFHQNSGNVTRGSHNPLFCAMIQKLRTWKVLTITDYTPFLN